MATGCGFVSGIMFAIIFFLIGFLTLAAGADTQERANTNQLAPKNPFLLIPVVKFTANGVPRFNAILPTATSKHKNVTGSKNRFLTINQRTAKALEVAEDPVVDDAITEQTSSPTQEFSSTSSSSQSSDVTPQTTKSELSTDTETSLFQELTSTPREKSDSTTPELTTVVEAVTSSKITTTTEQPTTTEETLSTTEETVSTTEETVSTTQEVALTTQEVALTTQEVALTTQQVASTTQEVASTTPPEVTSPTQEVTLTTQEVTSTTQEVTSTTQEVTSTTQEVTSTTQEVTSTTQEVTSTTQEVTSTTQEVTSTTQVALTAQEVAATTQEVSSTTQVALTAQEVAATTQEVSSTTQEVTLTTQEVTSTTPDLTSPTQEVTSVSQDVTSTTSEATTTPEITTPPEVTTTPETITSPEVETTTETIATHEVAAPTTATATADMTTTIISKTLEVTTTTEMASNPKVIIEIETSPNSIQITTTEAASTPEVTDSTSAESTQEAKAATESKSSPSIVTIQNEIKSPEESTSSVANSETTQTGDATTNEESVSNSESPENTGTPSISTSTATEASAPQDEDGTSNSESAVRTSLATEAETTVGSRQEVTTTVVESTSGSPSPHLIAPPQNSDSKTNLVGHQVPSVMARNETSNNKPNDQEDTTETNSEVTTIASNVSVNSNSIAHNSSDVINGTQLYLTLSKRIRLNVERMLGDQLPLGFDVNKIEDRIEQKLDHGFINVKNKTTNSTNTVFEAVNNFATLSIAQIMDYPIEAFTAVKEREVRTVNSEQAKAIMERLKTTENTTLWRNMGELLKEKVDQTYLISMMSNAPNVLGSAASGMVQSLGRRLGSTATWNSSIVEGLGSSVLLLLPSEIMRIKDKETKAKILGIMWNSDTFRNQSEVQTDEEVLLTSLIQDVYGPVEEWTTINETLSKYLPRMSPLILNKIRHEVVNNSLIVIGGVDYRDRQHAQPIIAKAMDSVNFSAIGLPAGQEFFHSLGKLISHLRFEDMETLPRHLLVNDGILATLARNPDIDKELARWILALNQPTSGEWKKSDVIRMHYFLQFSSGRLLRQLSTQDLLDRQTVTSILKKPDLEMGQLQAVREMSISLYKHDGQWDIESAPAGLLSVLTASDIEKLRPEDVVNNLDKFNQIIEFMDASQKMAVTKKLVELGLRRTLRSRNRVHPDFLSLISMSDINTLKEDDQLELLQSLSIDSPQVRNYVNDRITNNITIGSFRLLPRWQHCRRNYIDEFKPIVFSLAARKNSLLAKSFTCETLEKFKTEEIMELLGVLRASSDTCPLQYKTAKCFVEKLKSYMSKLPVEIEDGDEETKLLSTLKESELAIVGGEILIHFSADSLQDQHPPSRCLLIFSLIGQLPLSIINLVQPYEKKQQLARAAINCLDKQEDIMGLSEMMTIGNFMGYLPEISIDKLGSEAFALNLPRLLGDSGDTCQRSAATGLSNKAKIKPCLNLGMRNAIRRKLPIVFGLPSSWCETVVQSIGCLISTLYHDQLRDINDRALLASIDKLNQCWDNDLAHKKGDKADIYATFCNKELLSASITIDEAERLLKIRLKNAALGDIAQLTRKRRLVQLTSAALKRLTCDVIRRVNSAITEITLEELDTLDDLELRDCLEDVGKYPMTLAKANYLWSRIKKAHNLTASEMDTSTYRQMGFIMQGITIEELSSMSLNDTSMISVFGQDRNFNLEQLRALASEVKTDYQADSSRYTPSDLLIFGNIICGFGTSDLEKLPTKYFIEVVYRLGDTISTCPPETRKTLATLAVKGFGHPKNWTSATVTSVGSIVGGLDPSDFSTIPGRSFDGLEANYVKAIPPSSIKNLEPHQFGNFSIEAINYLTEAQLSQLNSEQLSAVNQLKSLYGRGSAVSITGWMCPLLILAALLIT